MELDKCDLDVAWATYLWWVQIPPVGCILSFPRAVSLIEQGRASDYIVTTELRRNILEARDG